RFGEGTKPRLQGWQSQLVSLTLSRQRPTDHQLALVTDSLILALRCPIRQAFYHVHPSVFALRCAKARFPCASVRYFCAVIASIFVPGISGKSGEAGITLVCGAGVPLVCGPDGPGTYLTLGGICGAFGSG